MSHAVRGLSIVNDTELDVFLEFPCFPHDLMDQDLMFLSRGNRDLGAKTGASLGFSLSAAPVWGFSRGMTGSSGSLSCGAREVRAS